MKLIQGLGDFFALDIGTNAVRIVQLDSGNNAWRLNKYAYVPVDVHVTTSDSAESQRRLGEVIMTAIGQGAIRSRNVVIGIPSNKTFTTVVDVPMSNDTELRATMKYQVDQYIPSSVDDTKVDWVKLGPSLRAQNQQEVLITSVAQSYSEQRLEFVESLGLNVLAAEPDPIAMARALLPAGNQAALLLLDMGENSTDIVVVYGEAPRLVRTIPTGLGSFIKAATQNLNVQEDQARQFILKFGLASDRLDGQVLHALTSSLDGFVSEVTKSIKFFQTRYQNSTVSTILLSGFASAIPGLSEHLSANTGVQAQVANPWQDIIVSQEAQMQLGPVAHEFAAVIGLAKRSN
ncbi:pilus assembly protein PilM [Candidatus Saccharibacteria bacterium]|nr:MAG: pilus assembly protein PilM [Candidatus Saccharibacteria bacterium]